VKAAGRGAALALVLVGLFASNTDLVIALLFALAGPAWALWTTDRVIAKARQLAEDRRHSELLAAVEALRRRVVTGPRVAGWRRSKPRGVAAGGENGGKRTLPKLTGRLNGRATHPRFVSTAT
jgi:hypothetical protein